LTEFLYDGVNPVQETFGVTVLANVLTGLGIDEFLTRTDVPAGTTSTLLTDALGSTIALADSSGAIQTENTYEPFGKTTATGASNTNPFQYTGRENDTTGLYYYRARYYHPALQRFIGEDPLDYERTKGSNLYAYVVNNPLNFTDPSGLSHTGGRASCQYYDDRCNQSRNSKSCEPEDQYACEAAKCCRAFGEGPKQNCVRECLIELDRTICGDLSVGRQTCRRITHVMCYNACGFIPPGIPPECRGIL
jgi:RHS repeat-associated protein